MDDADAAQASSESGADASTVNDQEEEEAPAPEQKTKKKKTKKADKGRKEAEYGVSRGIDFKGVDTGMLLCVSRDHSFCHCDDSSLLLGQYGPQSCTGMKTTWACI